MQIFERSWSKETLHGYVFTLPKRGDFVPRHFHHHFDHVLLLNKPAWVYICDPETGKHAPAESLFVGMQYFIPAMHGHAVIAKEDDTRGCCTFPLFNANGRIPSPKASEAMKPYALEYARDELPKLVRVLMESEGL